MQNMWMYRDIFYCCIKKSIEHNKDNKSTNIADKTSNFLIEFLPPLKKITNESHYKQTWKRELLH